MALVDTRNRIVAWNEANTRPGKFRLNPGASPAAIAVFERTMHDGGSEDGRAFRGRGIARGNGWRCEPQGSITWTYNVRTNEWTDSNPKSGPGNPWVGAVDFNPEHNVFVHFNHKDRRLARRRDEPRGFF
jgi:hypothetical protein